jgi:hypothetical protein
MNETSIGRFLKDIEQKIYAAAQTPKLSECDPAVIHQLMSRVTVAIGQKLPSVESLTIIASTVCDTMPWATIGDIEQAVRMNIAGLLNERVQPYGEFSAAYLCEVLAQYQTVKGKAVIKYNEQQQRIPTTHQLTQAIVTDDDWRAMMQSDRNALMQNKEHWKIAATRMCRYLEDKGLIHDNTFTAEQWKELNGRAKIAVMERKKIGPKAIERMESHERVRFDQECLDEKKVMVYRWYLLNRMEVAV